MAKSVSGGSTELLELQDKINGFYTKCRTMLIRQGDSRAFIGTAATIDIEPVYHIICLSWQIRLPCSNCRFKMRGFKSEKSPSYSTGFVSGNIKITQRG